jgi:hypothetical protein
VDFGLKFCGKFSGFGVAKPDLANGAQFQVQMEKAFIALSSELGIACRSQDLAAP